MEINRLSLTEPVYSNEENKVRTFSHGNNESLVTENQNSSETNKTIDETKLIYDARIYSFLGHLFFVVADLFMKLYTENYHEKGVIIFAGNRASSSFIICLLYMKYHNMQIINLTYLGKNKKIATFNLIRQIANIIVFYLLTYSMSQLKLGIVSTLLLTYPIFQALQAPFILNEKVNKQYYIAFLIALFGVYLMTCTKDDLEKKFEDSYSPNYFLGTSAIVLCAFSAGILFNSIKVVVEEFDVYNMNLMASFWTSIFFYTVCLVFTPSQILLLSEFKLVVYSVLNGTFSFLALLYLCKSVEFVDPSKSSYITYMELPLLALFGYLFFGELLTLLEILGAVIILVTIIYVSYYIN